MIDKQMLKNFRDDFQNAMKSLEQKYGLVIELGSIRFTTTSFSGKLEAKEGTDKDDVNEKEFKKYCAQYGAQYGLSEEDYDRRFTYKDKEYIIVGISPSKRKYPILCQCVQDGRTYCFTVDLVKRLLGK